MGEPRCKLTKLGEVRRGILNVTVAHSALLEELAAFEKTRLLKALRQSVPDLSVLDIALSRDGRRLAYSGYGKVDGGYPSHAALVVRELTTGTQRLFPLVREATSAYAPTNLAWSRDGRHVRFDLGWEGTVPEVIDVDAASTLDDASPLPGIESAAWSFTPTCWSVLDRLAVGRWTSTIEQTTLALADIDDLDLVTGRYRSRGVNLYAWGMVCRDDGAVAVLPDVGSNDAGPLPSDLVVIRADGTSTVLGHGYTQIVGR